jgi:basic membrane lipoprotein Med (substrate-binding protein (PBP1-ABC) superfamily)
MAAARATMKNRIGIIGSVYSPSIIACVNAFALGAQSITPNIVVEVEWMEAPHDPNPVPVAHELLFTKSLVTNGADVIAHTLDNNIPVATVAETYPTGVYSIAANVIDACDSASVAPNTCLGTVYFNWGPLFVQMLEDVHKQTIRDYPRYLVPIQSSATDSVFGFHVIDQASAIAHEVDTKLNDLQSDQGVGRVFDGPIHSAQCEMTKNVPVCVPMGSRLDDQGLDQMCWLVDGIVTHSSTGDQPATIPPKGDCAPPAMN